MRGRPRKGTSVRFAPADGAVPPHAGDPVLGLRFNIEARYGGTVDVDLVREPSPSLLPVPSGGSPSLADRSAHAPPSSSICRLISGFFHICASTPRPRRSPICA